MNEIDRHWDVIVIGSGLGGLTAAARLAKAGVRVLVLEQHVFAGGYAHHFLRRVKGTKIVYDFDVALHQTGDLAPGRSMHGILGELGILDRIQLRRFDIAYRTRGPEHDLQIPAAADAYEKLLQSSFPEHASGIRDLFETLRRIDRAPGEALSDEAFASMGITLQQLIDAHVVDERFAAIFSTLWGYVGLVPSRLSAFAFASMWSSFHFGGCFYVKGGGQALSDSFVDVIEENGGKVLLRTEVAGITTRGGRVVGVETAKGVQYEAGAVVSNVPAPTTFGPLLNRPELANNERELAKRLPLACSIHQGYVGIRGDAAKLGFADRGMFCARSYDLDAEWDAMERGAYREQGWQIGNHGIADPGHAPEGRSILTISVMADGRLWMDQGDAAYREKKRELEAYMIERLAEGIPDIRDRIEVCEVGTPHTMGRYSKNPLGSIYGYAFTPESHSIHRPPQRTSVPGLYLAGAWTFPAAGFQGTMMSGHLAAGLIFEDVEGREKGGR